MIAPRRLTAAEVLAMGEAGVLAPDERVELIEGVLYTMTRPGSRHAAAVNDLTDILTARFRGRAIVSVQNPALVSELDLFEPDLTLLRPEPDYYAEAHPSASDVLLAVEVALTNLAFDRDRKLPRYAAAGVRELWIVDLGGGRTLAHRDPDPAAGGYRTRLEVAPGDEIAPSAFPEDPVAPLRRPST